MMYSRYNVGFINLWKSHKFRFVKYIELIIVFCKKKNIVCFINFEPICMQLFLHTFSIFQENRELQERLQSENAVYQQVSGYFKSIFFNINSCSKVYIILFRTVT